MHADAPFPAFASLNPTAPGGCACGDARGREGCGLRWGGADSEQRLEYAERQFARPASGSHSTPTSFRIFLHQMLIPCTCDGRVCKHVQHVYFMLLLTGLGQTTQKSKVIANAPGKARQGPLAPLPNGTGWGGTIFSRLLRVFGLLPFVFFALCILS